MGRVGSLVAALLVLALAAPFARAQPGRIVELTLRETLTAADVVEATATLFRGDGFEPPQARGDVRSFVLRFETRDADGEPATALAQLFVPVAAADAGSLLAFAPGSSGLVDACAPSLGYVQRGDLYADQSYVRYALAYAGQGLPVVVPNYLGFFDPQRTQPYFVAEAEAHVMLDALRAASTALADMDPRLDPGWAFAAGYSQGGHAALAAADLAASYAPELPLAGILGFGPSADVEVVLGAFPFVAPWILYAYENATGADLDASSLLQEPYGARLAQDVQRMCIGEAQAEYPGEPGALLRPELAASLRDGTLAETHPALHAQVEANRAGVASHGLPLAVFQGVNDPVVPIEDQHEVVARLCELGSAVHYPTYPESRHDTRYVAFEPALAWMRARTRREEVPSDCGTVPNP